MSPPIELGGTTGPKPRRGSIGLGIAIAIGIGFIAVVLILALPRMALLPRYLWMEWLGLWQLAWLGPLGGFYFWRGQVRTIPGLIIGGSLVLLFGSACGGLLRDFGGG